MTYEKNKNKVISYIEQSKKHYVKISERYLKHACGGNFFDASFFVLGIINRQIELLDGIMYAVNVKNLNVGGGLLRMLFENFYFFFYVYGFTTPNLDNNRLERFKKNGKLSIIDEKGRYITVKEVDMVHNLLKTYPKFENIYNETCKYIHFSNKHLYNFIENKQLAGSNQYFSIKIGLGNEYWTQGEEFDNYVSAVIEIDYEMKNFLTELVNYLESNNKSNSK